MTLRTIHGSARGRSPLLLGAAATFAAVPLVLLPAAAHAAPGDNGDVKIHDSATAVDNQRDDPKVCSFYLDAFNFDTIQKVSWTISQQPPTGNAQVLAGDVTLVNGVGHTANMTLPDGHYKLQWTFEGENGNAKQKVFMVSCATSSPSASASASASSSASASGAAATPKGGVGAGGGGSVKELSVPEVAGGAALIAGAAWAGVWARRRGRRSDAR